MRLPPLVIVPLPSSQILGGPIGPPSIEAPFGPAPVLGTLAILIGFILVAYFVTNVGTGTKYQIGQFGWEGSNSVVKAAGFALLVIAAAMILGSLLATVFLAP